MSHPLLWAHTIRNNKKLSVVLPLTILAAAVTFLSARGQEEGRRRRLAVLVLVVALPVFLLRRPLPLPLPPPQAASPAAPPVLPTSIETVPAPGEDQVKGVLGVSQPGYHGGACLSWLADGCRVLCR